MNRLFPARLTWWGLLAGAALGTASCQSTPATAETNAAPPAPAVPVLRLDTSTVVTHRDYPTTLQGRVDVEIRPQVAGTLARVLVDEGATVRVGQPLFQINDQLYRAQLATAQGALRTAEAARTTAQLDVSRYAPLVAGRVVAPIQLQNAQSNYQAAQATVDQARAGVAAARLNLGYTLVKAPVSGVLGRLPKRVGSLVGPTDTEALTLLSDVREVYAHFSLSETDFSAFKAAYPGTTLAEKLRRLPPVALVLPDGSTYAQPGRVNVVQGQVEAGTGAIGLRATFPNSGNLLRSGNTGRIRLSRRRAGVLAVPQAATFELQEKTFVYVLGDSNKVRQTPITILDRSGSSYLVRGLRPGQRLVTDGLDRLQDGMAVTPAK